MRAILKVLLVDDEPIIIEGLKKLINWDELGIACCLEAHNGMQALDIVRRERPNIMVCDMKMPEMDGIQLLKKARAEKYDLKVIVLSGFDHFEYVKSAMKYDVENYLLKPVDKEELTSTLLNIIDNLNQALYTKVRQRESFNILRENILNRLVTNRITANEFEDKAEFLGISLKGDLFRSVVFDLPELNPDLDPDGYEWRNYGVFNIVDELVAASGAGLVFRLISGSTVVLLGYPADKASPLDGLLNTCIESINRFIKADVLVCAGGEVRAPESIHLSFSEASRLLHCRYTSKRNRIIYYEQEAKAAQATRLLLKTRLTDIEDCIISCDENRARQLLDDLWKELELGGRFKQIQIDDVCAEIVFLIVNVIKRCRLDLEEVACGNASFAEFLEFERLSAFFDRMKELCANAIRLLKNHKQAMVTIRGIIEYINDNYIQGMSIKTLSSRFSISPAYLGQLIRNETGETFSDYLNKLRIKKAKELLSVTNHSVSDICMKIGYSDPNYFYKVFKKYTGINPSQFRLR